MALAMRLWTAVTSIVSSPITSAPASPPDTRATSFASAATRFWSIAAAITESTSTSSGLVSASDACRRERSMISCVMRAEALALLA